jgi:hypothetical protein
MQHKCGGAGSCTGKGKAATASHSVKIDLPCAPLDPNVPSAHNAQMIGLARKPAVNICCGIIIGS